VIEISDRRQERGGAMAALSSGAGLRIMGKGLEHEKISQKLGLVPTHTHRAGEIDKFGTPYPQDMWLFDSPLGKRKHLDTHLKWLAKQVEPSLGYLKTLKRKYKIDVFCTYTGNGDGGLSLSPTALSIFTELGIRLELSIILLRPK
jgi:Domain of unknown function (DUF4279)